ncbi:TonB-dependent receptor, partial [Enterovirga sp.]|uniref:TonB-dependent receptor plug domain-containing protein n=1 Tax=Enterovirga sp. TaxID=2026350 RepID=UPI0026272C79
AATRPAPAHRARAQASRPVPASVAAPTPDIRPAPTAEAVTVAATGNATSVAEIASTVTVITAADLEREQRRTVPDALQRVPGLHVVQSGGPGGQTSVFLRGSNANHVKVLIDGIDVSDPSTPNRSFDFGQLLTDDVDRIEVLRGPQSGLYGADAIGGVISVTTKRGEGPPRVTLKTEGGSYGTFNQFGSISGSREGFSYFLGVQHYRSDKTPVTPAELVVPGQRRNPNLHDNASFTTKLGYDVNEFISLNYVGRLIDSTLLATTDGGFPSRPNAFRSQLDKLSSFQRGEVVVNMLDGRFQNVFGVASSNLMSDVRDAPTLAGPSPVSRSIGLRTQYDYRGDLLIADGQRLVFGAQREDETLSNKTIRPTNGNSAGFVQLQQDWAQRVFLVSNVRYDVNDSFGEALTYRVAPAVILPGTETKLKGSVGTGFKAPTLSQLFQSYPAFNFYANPNLRPEESFGWDAGFEQPLPGGRVRVGALYFDTSIRNLIQAAQRGAVTRIDNVGRASAYGAEAFFSFQFSDALQATLSYTNTSTKDEINRQELLRRPRHKVATTVDWSPLERLTLSGTAVFVGSQVDGNRDFSVPRLRTQPYAFVNLTANYRATDQLTVFARVDNLFDRRIEDPTGFLRPGASAFAGLRITN